MNSLLYQGRLDPFETVADLLALPRVREYISNPEFTHLGYNKEALVAFWKGDEFGPVMHIIGHLGSPIVLPKTLSASQGEKA